MGRSVRSCLCLNLGADLRINILLTNTFAFLFFLYKYGSVLQMPVVTRSDCTQTNVEEQYMFYKNSTGFTAMVEEVDLSFASCQGANNQNNDLEAFVQQLVNDGKLGEAEQDIFKTRVVGHNNCPAKRDELLSDAGFESGFVIDESRWQFIVGKCESAVSMVHEV